MGCMKSKQTFPFPTPFEDEKQRESGESFMPGGRLLPRMPSSITVKEEVQQPSGINPVILEYAHRLSQEILRDALNQWAFNNITYYDIPYIECEEPDDAVG
ncbi:small membrane A-kinase anchor protein [Microcebus murinus]|uniref:small membrane A-kinase anchor protein n=1 Tax=Microcebus murinus TaxID=30608 RepID=UPI000642FCCA|nr:small membrane A-kinase anchor protein [Microcebus murinus]XP_012632333.1 small membrane A-kinase anchor protein [Microcebus murinus]XP_012632334.1 small membrane A-kinase anchor protein [Microcebus murinus]XP_012632335.1 small membrane A-kinase anchor protein [Microcebus murinus]XP_012632336.1 small membrane A-kinase anchor protein [Microcebus murinus]XP_012632337.1 small membrane A-kinase anchor protein [Microcebus murinus]